jgi:vacuolar-type H+-ATPase catalytic subunit A/Vma1
LRHLHELENIPIKLQGKILEKVFKIAEYSALSKSARREYDESLKNFNDLQNTLETADKDGFERGIKNMIPKVEEALKQKEEAEKKKEEALKEKEEAEQSLKKMIKKMIARNFTIQEIAEDLGKTEAEINAIIKEN